MINSDDLHKVTSNIKGKVDGEITGVNKEKRDEAPAYRKDQESFAGSMPNPESDDNVNQMMKEVTGNIPPSGHRGTTIGDEVNKDEASRHGSESTYKKVNESLASVPNRTDK